MLERENGKEGVGVSEGEQLLARKSFFNFILNFMA